MMIFRMINVHISTNSFSNSGLSVLLDSVRIQRELEV